MKQLVIWLALFLAPFSGIQAAGWSTIATVDRIEIVRGQGAIVFGAFGNPSSCTEDMGFWIKIDHPQYKELYSMAMTAMTSGQRLQPYLSACESIGWHGGTWNVLSAADSMNMYLAQ